MSCFSPLSYRKHQNARVKRYYYIKKQGAAFSALLLGEINLKKFLPTGLAVFFMQV